MRWRGIIGFTKFGDKGVNDLDYLVRVACLHRENSMQAYLHTPRFPYVLIIYSLPVLFVCNALFLYLLLYFLYVQTPSKPC